MIFAIPIRYGTAFYGKSDIVPGLFYVATKFIHFYGIPLIPYGSALVYENSQNIANSTSNAKAACNRLHINIPFNPYSLLFLITRIVLLIILVMDLTSAGKHQLAAGAASAATVTQPQFAGVAILDGSGITAAISMVLLYWSYKIAVASKDRALSLGALAGAPREMIMRSLALKGYPLRRPKKQLRFHQCIVCGFVNTIRLDLPQGSEIVCSNCNISIPQRSKRYISILSIIHLCFLLVAGAGLAYFIYFLFTGAEPRDRSTPIPCQNCTVDPGNPNRRLLPK